MGFSFSVIAINYNLYPFIEGHREYLEGRKKMSISECFTRLENWMKGAWV